MQRVNKLPSNSLDQGSKEMLYEGLNESQMMKVFRMDRVTIKERLVGVTPSGYRGGVPIYLISDVYSRLWKPTEEQVDDAMRRLSHNELPKNLTKEYWAGQRSRQEFEFQNGDLWQTTEVVEKFSALLKLVKMSLLLLPDEMARVRDLHDEQRAVVKRRVDSTLNDLYAMMMNEFNEPSGEQQKAKSHDEEL